MRLARPVLSGWLMAFASACGSPAPAAPPSNRPATAHTASPASSPSPSPTAAPAPAPSSELSQQQKLARELEGLDMAAIGSGGGQIGPGPEEVVNHFIEAANAGDARKLGLVSTDECMRAACASLAAQAGKKFTLRQVGSVTTKGRRAAASADAICGSRPCDSLHLLLAIASTAQGNAAWRVAEVTESDTARATWLTPPQTPSPAPAPAPGPVKIEGPKAVANIGAISGGNDVADAARVIAGMRAGMRACFQRHLAEQPDSKGGTVTLELKIGANGAVSTVSVSTKEIPASSSAVQCMRARASAAQFSAPKSGGATLKFVVHLTRT